MLVDGENTDADAFLAQVLYNFCLIRMLFQLQKKKKKKYDADVSQLSSW